MKAVLSFLFWVVSVIALFYLSGYLLLNEVYVPGGLSVLLGVWVLFSMKIVGPDEMAILIVLGKPSGFRDSGFRFVPLFFAELARYPKTLFNLSYPDRKVITKADNYNYKDYGSQVLTISAVAYLRFPRSGDGLQEILRSQVPTDEEGLKAWTKEAVDGALRVALGKMTWKEAAEDIKKVTSKAERVFKHADGALLRAGFIPKDIQLTIEEIKLPPELEKVLPEVDRQRLESEAAHFEAEQRAIETMGSMVRMMAQSRGKTFEEIQDSITTDIGLQKELLELSKDLTTREQALGKNALLDIRVPGGTTIEGLLALLQRVPKGGGPREEPRSSKKRKKKKIMAQRGGEWHEVESEEDEKEDEEEETEEALEAEFEEVKKT